VGGKRVGDVTEPIHVKGDAGEGSFSREKPSLNGSGPENKTGEGAGERLK